MIKAIILFSTISFMFSAASAKEFVCSIAGNNNTSLLKIDYSQNTPSQLSLKSPDSEIYRNLDLDIEVVVLGEDNLSFSAKPKAEAPIDWSIEPNCYKEIGTQWYFIFDYAQESYSVYLTPFFVLGDSRCVPPRYSPQPKSLNCDFLN